MFTRPLMHCEVMQTSPPCSANLLKKGMLLELTCPSPVPSITTPRVPPVARASRRVGGIEGKNFKRATLASNLGLGENFAAFLLWGRPSSLISRPSLLQKAAGDTPTDLKASLALV